LKIVFSSGGTRTIKPRVARKLSWKPTSQRKRGLMIVKTRAEKKREFRAIPGRPTQMGLFIQV
jgi:hypothetical protein